MDLDLANLVDPTAQVSFAAPDDHTLTIIDDDTVSSTPEVEEIVYFNQDANAEKNFSPDGTGQRSIIRRIRVTFSGPVSVALGPVTDDRFVLESAGAMTLGMRVGLEVLSSQLLGGKQVVVLGFTGTDLIEDASENQPVVRPMLEDGNYRLTVDGSILGIDANAADPGVDAVDDFFRFSGDTDGDRDVDGSDFYALWVYLLFGVFDAALDFDQDSHRWDFDVSNPRLQFCTLSTFRFFRRHRLLDFRIWSD